MNEIDRNPRIFRILNEDALETHAAVPTAGRAMPEKQQYFLQHIL